MPNSPTQLAIRTRQSLNWSDARQRVLSAYRAWYRAAPEIQTTYNVPVSAAQIRTRVREEFERNRFVNKLPIVDMLLLKNNADYQETMNYWRQTSHIMSFFPGDNFRDDKRLPNSFLDGFLEGRN